MQKEETTYIYGAEIRLDNTTRRDRLVKAAKDAGFIVDFTRAFDVSFSGATGPEYWSISVSVPGKHDLNARREFRAKLMAAWKGL